MHETVVLRFFEDGNGLVVGDVVTTAGLREVVGHIAHTDAPVAVVVGTALVKFLAAVTAGADAHAQMAFITLKPIGYVLNINTLILHRDGFLHGDDVHPDTCAAHRHHRGDLFQRQESHTFEEHRQFGMLVHQVGVHIGVFGAAGHEHRHPIDAVLAVVGGAGHRTVVSVFVAIVVLQHSKVGKFVKEFVKRLIIRSVVLLFVPFVEQLIGAVLTNFQSPLRQHIKEQVQRGLAGFRIHLIFKDAGQSPVFGGVSGHFDLAGHAVGDLADELQQFRVRVLVPFVFRDKFG